jgi:hypothetical protein
LGYTIILAGALDHKPTCAQLTAKVGVKGLTYSVARRVWNNLAATSGKDNAIVASLGVLTWGWETGWGFDIKPPNHLNRNGSIDYGPFQINSSHLNEVSARQQNAIFGTDRKPNDPFNGDPDANIQFGLNQLNYLASKYGPEGAIQKYNTGENSRRPVPNRASSWDIYGWALTDLFHNTDCFPMHL